MIIASNGKTVPMNAETRHLFAYVPQGNTILSGTIAENMRMVKEDATDEEIIEALKISCAWDFVQHLPDTINSRVGERGRCFWMKPPRHWTLRRNETSSETSSVSVPTKPVSLRRTVRVSSASARESTVS